VADGDVDADRAGPVVNASREVQRHDHNMVDNATFLLRLPPPAGARADAVRVAIKDLIDLVGTPTTAGSRAVARMSVPAERDATCLSGIRAAEARGDVVIVGKTNLHELAYGGDGINPAYGTPINPLDPHRVPGGSSSGSAVAVATGAADIALGSDTGGSIRIPSHCCGTAGLKTTWGRVTTSGVHALAPFLDTIGPMARDVAGVVAGMDLLEPGFAAAVEQRRAQLRRRVALLVGPGDEPAAPGLDTAVIAACERAGIEVVIRHAPWWNDVAAQSLTVLVGEAWRGLRHLLDRADGLEPRIAARIGIGESVSDRELTEARRWRPRTREFFAALLAEVDAIALPTLPIFAPLLGSDEVYGAPYTAYTRPANIAGTPALTVPVPLVTGSAAPQHAHLRGSVQLMSAADDDAVLCALGLLF
jgi:amidase